MYKMNTANSGHCLDIHNRFVSHACLVLCCYDGRDLILFYMKKRTKRICGYRANTTEFVLVFITQFMYMKLQILQ